MKVRHFSTAIALLLTSVAMAQEPSSDPLKALKPGELPTYEVLRFRGGTETKLGESYLQSLPTANNDVITSGVIFPEVDASAAFARMDLRRLVAAALDSNLTLQNSARNVTIARSDTRSTNAPFVPFVDLVTEGRVAESKDKNARYGTPPNDRPTQRDTSTLTTGSGVDTGVTLPTNGTITGELRNTRTDTESDDGRGDVQDDQGYTSSAGVRYLQPLLRGGGLTVGQANLRQARLREMTQVISDKIAQRDVVLRVIENYFQILQTARQLQVSSDAIRERSRFLEETRIKYDVGRVGESEILRAEIQYLSELETAISRRQQLDDRREVLLLTLGLPLETPLSLVDITPTLIERGRVDIPLGKEAVEETLSNRMELMQEDLRLAVSEIDRKVARNDLLPQLDWDSGYRRTDADGVLNQSLGFENQDWDTGLSLRVPLVNIRRIEAAKRASISLENQRTNRLSTERDLTQEATSGQRSVLATEASLTILSKNVEQARKNLKLINDSFEVGFSTVTEVRLAQDDLFQSETRYVSTLLNYQIQLARFYVALGRPLIP